MPVEDGPDGLSFRPSGAPRVVIDAERTADMRKALMEGVLRELQKETYALDEDSWMYEAPRSTDK